MGDIDGDGYDDMLFTSNDLSQQFGVPDVRTVGVLNGKTGLFFGAPNVHPDPALALSSQWGHSICVIGDLDGDGSNEYAVGAPGSNYVHVFWGNPPATVFADNLVCVIEQLPAPAQGPNSNPRFGHSLAMAGDLNVDGIPDLWIGDNSVQTSGNADVRIGAVYLISGYEMIEAWKLANNSGNSSDRVFDSNVNMGKITMVRDLTGVQYLGEQLAGGVEATNDAYPDLLITARHVDFVLNQSPWHSGVLLFSGRRFFRPVHTYMAPSAYTQSTSADETFGASISFVGDIEGPGTATNGLELGLNDVLIGDPGDHTQGDPGYAFVFSSASANLLELMQGTSNNGTGTSMGETVASAGDVDGDTFGDYFVAEPRFRLVGETPGAGHGRGQVFIVKGGTGLSLPPNQAIRLDDQQGTVATARHGTGMASSSLPLVYIPGAGFTAVGFVCYSKVSTTSSPDSLTSTEYH